MKNYTKSASQKEIQFRSEFNISDDKMVFLSHAGVTMASKTFILDKLEAHCFGKAIEIVVHKAHCNNITAIKFKDAVIIVQGFTFGYTGEGPRGLQWALDLFGFDYMEHAIFDHQEDGSRSFGRKAPEKTQDQLTEELIAVKFKCYKLYLRSLTEEFLAMEYCDHIGDECGELQDLTEPQIMEKLEDWCANVLFDDPMYHPINQSYKEQSNAR